MTAVHTASGRYSTTRQTVAPSGRSVITP